MIFSAPHRTDGTTRDCKGCRYWSEMLAKSEGYGPVQAVCLAPAGPHATRRGTYVGERQDCGAWAPGYLGAIDEPSEDPARYEDNTP